MLFGQTDNGGKYRFAKEVFNSKEYVKSEYDRFSGKIDSIDSNTYKLGEKILKIEIGNTEFLKLIDNRIFQSRYNIWKGNNKKTESGN
ncbi:hypothetical protein [Formosa algae]|uniref:hypothetical protein n=1 Tax=Formosa algae TaxID=225843 RepID=UPI000CCE3F21|nr:hypothetical protein [Formosa algae]PNW25762.1 hypothetical protein BKP44_19145 [Formosa algae]